MMEHRRTGNVVALLAGLALAAGGCGGKGLAGSTYQDPHPLPADTLTFATREIGTHGGRFVLGQTSGPKSFNAIMANETSTTDLTDGRLFLALIGYNNGGQYQYPWLAKSWEMSPDGLTWTFHLRHGAAFSDGHPITAEDVLFSFEVCYDEKLHPSIQDLLSVAGKPFELSAPDSYTVVMKVAAPYAMMVGVCYSVPIMPKHILEPAFRSGNFASAYSVSTPPESLVTSGPWRVKEYVASEKVVLGRNPYYFGVDAKGQRLPYLDEVVFVIVPDQNTAALKFLSGGLDGLDNVKPEDYKTYTDKAKAMNFTLHELGPALTTNFFWFNLNTVKKPTKGKKLGGPLGDPVKYAWFNNPAFRRAVSMAIDRDAIIRGPFYGEGVKNWSTSTLGNKEWYSPDLVHYDHNPEEAKQLLASLGWKDQDGDGYLEDTQGHPISFTMKTNGDNAVRMAMCNFVRDDLAKVGIKCIPTGVDFNTLVTNIREDFQYEAILLGLQSGVPPDPGMGQNVYRSSGPTHYWNVKQKAPENETEASFDRLIEANIATLDMAERHRTWTALQNLMNEQGFFIWLPTLKAKVPVSNRFGNVQPSVIPHRLLWNIDRVYLKSRGTRV